MLDVARHFFGVADVCRVIDHLADYKLNVLHLHLSDDQGWRLAIDARPRLAEVGGRTAVGGDPGGHYTQDDFRAIVAYAAERFVTIVPEIDTPGPRAGGARGVPRAGGRARQRALHGDGGGLLDARRARRAHLRLPRRRARRARRAHARRLPARRRRRGALHVARGLPGVHGPAAAARRGARQAGRGLGGDRLRPARAGRASCSTGTRWATAGRSWRGPRWRRARGSSCRRATASTST